MNGKLQHTLATAEKFLNRLILGTREPEAMFEDDGDISFEWYAGKDAQISVSVGAGYINWAWHIDGESGHNRCDLGDIPLEVTQAIARIEKRMSPSHSE